MALAYPWHLTASLTWSRAEIKDSPLIIPKCQRHRAVLVYSDPVPGDLQLKCSLFSVWCPCLCSYFEQLLDSWLVRAGGFHPAHAGGRPRAHCSRAWCFLTGISPSILLCLQLQCSRDESLFFPLRTAAYVVDSSSSLGLYWGMSENPIHISHHALINWCFISWGLPKEASIWSLNLITNPFSPLPFPLLSQIRFLSFLQDMNPLPEVSQISAVGHWNLLSEAGKEKWYMEGTVTHAGIEMMKQKLLLRRLRGVQRPTGGKSKAWAFQPWKTPTYGGQVRVVLCWAPFLLLSPSLCCQQQRGGAESGRQPI